MPPIATITNLRHTVDPITVDGGMVATVVTVTGTHPGAFIGETPIDDEISFVVLGMDWVEDGRIVLYFPIPNLILFGMMVIGTPAPMFTYGFS